MLLVKSPKANFIFHPSKLLEWYSVNDVGLEQVMELGCSLLYHTALSTLSIHRNHHTITRPHLESIRLELLQPLLLLLLSLPDAPQIRRPLNTQFHPQRIYIIL